MTKAAMPGLELTDIEMDALTITKFEQSPIDIRLRIVPGLKDLTTRDSNRRTKFDSAVRQLVEDTHASIPLKEGITIALNGARREETSAGSRQIVDVVQRNFRLLTIKPCIRSHSTFSECLDDAAFTGRSGVETDRNVERLILREVC